MVLKILWSKSSEKEFIKTLIFWIEYNKSNSYSIKLFQEIENTLKLVSEFPDLGLKSNYKNNRVIITSKFKLIYEANKKEIKIKRFFDCRRNPKNINKF
jgi:toxin YoeB